jgi:hypothetical protein
MASPESMVQGGSRSFHVKRPDWKNASVREALEVSPTRIRVRKEIAFVVLFAVAYEALAHGVTENGPLALRHALSIAHVEQELHVFHEEQIQAAFLHFPNLVRGFNLYYGTTHFLVPAGALIWLAIRHPERYIRARTVLAVTTLIGFAVFWRFPVAPPRLLPARFGIIDTLVRLGKSGHFESSLINSAGDVYASMPSLHVAWALWCAIALYPVVRHRILRALVVAYPMLTMLVVIVTGNHFFFDGMAGAIVVTATWMSVTELHKHLAHQVRPVTRSRSRCVGPLTDPAFKGTILRIHRVRVQAPGSPFQVEVFRSPPIPNSTNPTQVGPTSRTQGVSHRMDIVRNPLKTHPHRGNLGSMVKERSLGRERRNRRYTTTDTGRGFDEL